MPELKDNIVFSRALFNIAKEKNNLDKYLNEFKLFIDFFDSEYNLQLFIFNYGIGNKKKKKIIMKIFQNNLSKEFIAFINIIIVKDFQKFFKIIYFNYRNLVDSHKNIVRAIIYSVVELDNDIISSFKELLDKHFNKNFVLQLKINPKIIGGFVLHFQDSCIDLSVLNTLNIFKDKFLMAKITERIKI